MKLIDDTFDRIDGLQRRMRIVGFPLAVMKRYGEDHGGWLGAVITYYGFFALLPLLIAFVTLVSIVFDNHPEVRDDILNAVWSQLPFVGDDIKASVKPVAGSPWVVTIALLVTLWGASNVMRVAQDTTNSMWCVPRYSRPGFFPKLIRGLVVFGLLGLGVIGSAVITGLSLGLDLPTVSLIAVGLASIVLNTLVTLGLFELLTSRHLTLKQMLAGALLVGVGTYFLTLAGGIYVQRVVARASSLYGSFGVIVGLFAWLALGVQIFVYGTLVNVVREEKLWPRTLTGRNLGPPDHRAVDLTMRRTQLVAQEQLEDVQGSRVEADQDREK